MRDYYNILGINNNASEKEVKDAYKKMVIKYHPDKNKAPEALNKFKEVTNAYEILSDKNKRLKYDISLKHGDEFHYQFRNPYEIFDEFIQIVDIINDTLFMVDDMFQNKFVEITIIQPNMFPQFKPISRMKPRSRPIPKPKPSIVYHPQILKKNDRWITERNHYGEVNRLNDNELEKLVRLNYIRNQ